MYSKYWRYGEKQAKGVLTQNTFQQAVKQGLQGLHREKQRCSETLNNRIMVENKMNQGLLLIKELIETEGIRRLFSVSENYQL